MKIRLHEIELNTQDPAASKAFYENVIGLPLTHSLPAGLNVFNAGVSGVDFDTSMHRPGKAVVSFVTDDLDVFVKAVRAKGVKVPDPASSHLGLRSVELTDPDGHIVVVQGLTVDTPPWLKEQLGL